MENKGVGFNMLNAYKLLTPIIPHLVGSEKICIWATDEEKYILYHNPGNINLPLEEGSLIFEESTPRLAINSQEVIDRIVPREVYGTTIRSVCIPVPGGTIGLTTDTEDQRQVIESLKQLAEMTHSIAGNTIDITEQSNVVKNNIDSVSRLTNQGNEKRNELKKITDILFHMTENLRSLSINARIEASRAGEFGRAFTVVAEEVKRLAEESREKIRYVSHSVEEVSDILVAIDSELKVIKELATSQHGHSHEISSSIQSVSSALDNLQEMAQRFR